MIFNMDIKRLMQNGKKISVLTFFERNIGTHFITIVSLTAKKSARTFMIPQYYHMKQIG